MKATIQIFAYCMWAVWLLVAVWPTASPREIKEGRRTSSMRPLLGMVLSTLAILGLFFWITFDYQTATHLYPEKYTFKISEDKREIIVGRSDTRADIVLENSHADDTHVRLTLEGDRVLLGNVSRGKNVDVNGRYLNKWRLREGDVIEIDGRDQIKIADLHRQFPWDDP